MPKVTTQPASQKRGPKPSLATIGSALIARIGAMRAEYEAARKAREITRLKAHLAWQPDADRTPRVRSTRGR